MNYVIDKASLVCDVASLLFNVLRLTMDGIPEDIALLLK